MSDVLQIAAAFVEQAIPEEIQRLMVAANVHLARCISLYARQLECGRYFLHEHPDRAVPWDFPLMRWLARQPGVLRLVGHQCAHGMKAKDEQGEGLVLKPTGWLTDSWWIGKEVSAKCSNLRAEWAEEQHRHVRCMSSKITRACEVYPQETLQSHLARIEEATGRGWGVGQAWSWILVPIE